MLGSANYGLCLLVGKMGLSLRQPNTFDMRITRTLNLIDNCSDSSIQNKFNLKKPPVWLQCYSITKLRSFMQVLAA